MNRRLFLGAFSSLGAGGCFGRVEDEQMSGVVPGDQIPWTLWGSTDVVRLNLETTGAENVSQQIVKVDYKRPDTFSMFFGARIVAGPTFSEIVTVQVDFNLIIGIGRGNFPTAKPNVFINSFRNFTWQVPAGAAPAATPHLWANSGQDFVNNSAPTREKIDFIPAQSIQCQAIVRGGTILPGAGRYDVEVSAFFAPRTHVRPDWFKDQGAQFQGGEIGGK